MTARGLTLWGVADLRGFPTPIDERGLSFPFAISFAVPMTPEIMDSIREGPNQAYADEYARVNDLIDELSADLAGDLWTRGHRARALPASDRTDPENLEGDFPHKTAATQAGFGWIGRHCQLVTRPFGSWVRLGTVFTDLEMPLGRPVERHFCGGCKRCVEACPAQALTGKAWTPGMPREKILDARACDEWKKEHYFQFHEGHNCGICSAVCPYGVKVLKKVARGR
jgi:epoxyqueuosine reductase QueG